MNDFTKNKLINSLIDVVEKFYEQKNSNNPQDNKHLKGFCEGMSYTLIELEYLTTHEASKILKGLGKKRILKEEVQEVTLDDRLHEVFSTQKETEELDIPTYLRKH